MIVKTLGEKGDIMKTNWTKATVDANAAMLGLISCVQHDKNAWIEVQKNGEQEYPIMKKNPALDDPFNWTMLYGVPYNEKELTEHSYFNDTERDLTIFWTACYGIQSAIDAYQKDRTLLEGLIMGGGICHPVRIEDAVRYREMYVGDGYKYNTWTTFWKPKEGIPYYVVDERIEKVFVICYDNEPVDAAAAIRRAAQFMLGYADSLTTK